MTPLPNSRINRRDVLKSGAIAGGTLIAGCFDTTTNDDASPDEREFPEPQYGDPDREYHLRATESEVMVATDEPYNGWTYNGEYPGPEIRAVEGERVRVTVENVLPEETTIHWHGMLLNGDNAMDGVPGVTQAAIEPGEEFVYEFDAEPAGTHWYHSHVGLKLDRELLGPLIIEERDPHIEYDTEATLILDEYLPTEPRVETSSGNGGGMGRMGGMGGGGFPDAPPAEGTLINGRLPEEPATIDVEEGDQIRLRLINAAAAATYEIGIDDHELTVTHTDGPAVEPVPVDTLEIGPGERYDVVVEARSPGTWPIRIWPVDESTSAGRALLDYEQSDGNVTEGAIGSRQLQLTDLNAIDSLDAYSGEPDRTIDFTLSGGMMGGDGDEWIIDGQAYPDADPIGIEEGEHVRFRMVNRSPIRHPMHLHGHHFAVGDALKDTVIVPGHMGEITIDFVAENPGAWFFHCHHLYHMETGMTREVLYEQ
ncbi:multicopper oxidase family protein [Halobacteria archaeon AArc-curdl1]|uniref:Multicopper oxidase family protein n=1 Tax=Natronosalvus hydrolyticus TaxID=2979988 RepID=A0AAP2Z7W9_9EURY|nr:multicopper oxidase family protein [Halobacteria archaeon AArc-curdl1]